MTVSQQFWLCFRTVVCGVVLSVTSFEASCQEVLSIRRIPGPQEMEISGTVLRSGIDKQGVVFVGRSGVWQLDTASNVWRQIHATPSGTLILTSTEERDGSVVFLDTKKTLWRYRSGSAADSITTLPIVGELYAISSDENALIVCAFNRVISTIEGLRITPQGVEEIQDLVIALSNLSMRSLEYSDRCSTTILNVQGRDTGQVPRQVYRRYVLNDRQWIEINENDEKSRSIKDGATQRTCMLYGDSLYTTAQCPPSMPEQFVMGLTRRAEMATLSDSTTALYLPYLGDTLNREVFIVNAESSRIVDTIRFPRGYELINVIGANDHVAVNCYGMLFLYRGRTLNQRILWPTVESSATYPSGVQDGANILMHGGYGLPYVLDTRTSVWSAMFALRNGDTSRITAIDQGVSSNGVMYAWYGDRLYVSRDAEPTPTFYDVVPSPRRIMHVRPIDNGDALVAVAIPDRDSTTPYWYKYSRATGLLTPSSDNWPRFVNGLEPIASIYDPQSATIMIGTRTEWFDDRTDTSVYPIYGVLRRTEPSVEWSMANEGLGVSLRCFDLQRDDHGRLFMLSTYSNGTLNMPRANFYVSTNLGSSWQSASQPLPIDLGKKYSLSVTSNGVFVHDNSCYRVASNGEMFSPVTFSIEDVGTIYSLLSGKDSSSMVMLTSTGAYEASVSTTSVAQNDEPHDDAVVVGSNIIVRARAFNHNEAVRLISSAGNIVCDGVMQQLGVDQYAFPLPAELPSGVYFLVTSGRAMKFVYLKT